jgi:hypothetical protein
MGVRQNAQLLALVPTAKKAPRFASRSLSDVRASSAPLATQRDRATCLRTNTDAEPKRRHDAASYAQLSSPPVLHVQSARTRLRLSASLSLGFRSRNSLATIFSISKELAAKYRTGQVDRPTCPSTQKFGGDPVATRGPSLKGAPQSNSYKSLQFQIGIERSSPGTW